jgi:hypothetical protein
VSAAGFHLEVRVDEIIVTLSGTNYLAVYYKSDNSPRLLARHFPKKNDDRSLMGQSEFLAMAWKLANDKARAIGWIV